VCRDNDGQGSQRAARLLPGGNLVRKGCLQHGLERALMDFAWR
jgi:hypothetical protein